MSVNKNGVIFYENYMRKEVMDYLNTYSTRMLLFMIHLMSTKTTFDAYNFIKRNEIIFKERYEKEAIAFPDEFEEFLFKDFVKKWDEDINEN